MGKERMYVLNVVEEFIMQIYFVSVYATMTAASRKGQNLFIDSDFG